MPATILQLTIAQLDNFLNIFYSVLNTDFPVYSTDVLNYFKTQAYSKNNFIYWLQNKMKYIFVAETVTHQLVGFAVIDCPYGGVSLCRWLGVLPEYQKKGIGTKLIQSWLNLARSQGCHKAELAAQDAAKIFYEKVGLIYEGKRNNSYFGIDQHMFGISLGEFQNILL